MRTLITAWILILMFIPARPASAQTSADEQAVSTALDNLHDAASKAQFDRYFGLYAENAIFFGTDATERWTVDEFKAYAKPSFDQGSGWTFVTTERHIFFSDDGNTAWFDEAQTHEQYGVTRGTGVLVRAGDNWKIAQYNLTVPIPNDLLLEFAARIIALGN